MNIKKLNEELKHILNEIGCVNVEQEINMSAAHLEEGDITAEDFIDEMLQMKTEINSCLTYDDFVSMLERYLPANCANCDNYNKSELIFHLADSIFDR